VCVTQNTNMWVIITIIIIIKNECHSNIIVDRLQGCELISTDLCSVKYLLFVHMHSRTMVDGNIE